MYKSAHTDHLNEQIFICLYVLLPAMIHQNLAPAQYLGMYDYARSLTERLSTGDPALCEDASFIN